MTEQRKFIMSKKYQDINIGDYLFFSKTFFEKDFHVFSELSGDSNLLHHDKEYAKHTDFGRPIVPMHLTAMPLSSVAGMGFPGKSALYLKNINSAIKPVYYGDELTYSAKVIEKTDSKNALKLRVLVFRQFDVVMESELLVKVRNESEISEKFTNSNEYEIYPETKGTVIVTGASGAIGASLCMQLARRGYNLVVNYRKENNYIKDLTALCESLDLELTCIQGSLSDPKTLQSIYEIVESDINIVNFIHTSCPPIESDLADHMSINFDALKQISRHMFANMLKQQKGKVIFIGSTAIHYNPEGWENYVAAKVASSNYLDGLHRRYSRYGLEFITFSPGYVRTKFSEKYLDDNIAVLLPEQVAEAVVEQLDSQHGDDNYIWMDEAGIRNGSFGFRKHAVQSSVSAKNEKIYTENDQDRKKGLDIEEYVRNFFDLDNSFDLQNSGIDQLPGWDSMKHIELMLYLEKNLGINFSSDEIDKTSRFSDLAQLVNSKI